MNFSPQLVLVLKTQEIRSRATPKLNRNQRLGKPKWPNLFLVHVDKRVWNCLMRPFQSNKKTIVFIFGVCFYKPSYLKNKTAYNTFFSLGNLFLYVQALSINPLIMFPHRYNFWSYAQGTVKIKLFYIKPALYKYSAVAIGQTTFKGLSLLHQQLLYKPQILHYTEPVPASLWLHDFLLYLIKGLYCMLNVWNPVTHMDIWIWTSPK